MFQNLVNTILRFFRILEDTVPVAYNLDKGLNQMQRGLDEVANKASFSMARSQEMAQKLKDLISEYEKYTKQAQKFADENKDKEAIRCIQLKNQTETTILNLKNDYVELKKAAEEDKGEYKQLQKVFEDSKKAVFSLKDEIRHSDMQKRVDSFDTDSFTSAQADFDKVARRIGMQKRELQNKRSLNIDPNKQIDDKIHQQIEHDEIKEELALLKSQDVEITSPIEDIKLLVN